MRVPVLCTVAVMVRGSPAETGPDAVSVTERSMGTPPEEDEALALLFRLTASAPPLTAPLRSSRC